MEDPSVPQLDLFDPDAELSAIGVTRQQLAQWGNADLISFDPQTPTLERWMLQEAAFIHHLNKVEWSANALRQILGPLQRPYLYDHGRHFLNFEELQWQRKYDLQELHTTALLENPEDAGKAARALIRRLAFLGERKEVFKTLAVLREVLPDDWLRDVLPEE